MNSDQPHEPPHKSQHVFGSPHDLWTGRMAQFVANSVYSFNVEGQQHLPKDSGFLVACNHVSFVDWMFIMAGLAPRPVRFLIDENFTNMPVVGSIIGLSQAIPICIDTVKPRSMRRSLDDVIEALGRNEVIGVFPEGGLTRDGNLKKFRTGIELIARKAQAPVVPAALSGLWGSIWSWEGGRLLWKLPSRLRMDVILKFGEPMDYNEIDAQILHERVQSLRY